MYRLNRILFLKIVTPLLTVKKETSAKNLAHVAGDFIVRDSGLEGESLRENSGLYLLESLEEIHASEMGQYIDETRLKTSINNISSYCKYCEELTQLTQIKAFDSAYLC